MRTQLLIIFSLFFVLSLLTTPWAGIARAGLVTDGAGRQVMVPADPRRVITFAPNLAEIVYLLGEEQRLAGTTTFSDYPPAARELPRVGSYVRPDLEKIVALRPDLCLASQDGNPRHVVDRLAAMGIAVYVVNPQSLSGIMTAVKQIGTLLHADKRAAELVAAMRQRIEAVARQVAARSDRPLVFFQIDEAPMISAGTNTFIHELITLAGGRNAAAGPVAYPRYDWEKILALDPEIVIISSMAGGRTKEELLAGWRRWPQLAAVRNNRLHVVDADLFDRATPRLVDGLEHLAGIIQSGQESAGAQ
ncbi:MAG: cobalamin-binding protein [Deltaproteobacteria bacterium RIFOXYD12_FULL_57_12]|nr:MAG: cobalamin-binding protein [Deltaproteobacteria bacterium RIFOXYD12_FULL_57_12]